mgnify:CR=1 FL=1
MGDPSELVLLGEIVAVHGVRGLVKVRAYTEDAESLTGYGPLFDQHGRPVNLSLRGRTKGGLLAAIDGVGDRTQAEAQRGRKLFVRRDALPPADVEDEEYYHADLIDLAVELDDGSHFGRITAVHTFGAGDMLEILPDGGGQTVLVPFNRDLVPVVDIAAGRVVIAPIPGLLE